MLALTTDTVFLFFPYCWEIKTWLHFEARVCPVLFAGSNAFSGVSNVISQNLITPMRTFFYKKKTK